MASLAAQANGKLSHALNGICCRDIALGTASGTVLTISYEEKEKKERWGGPVLELATGQAIKGLSQLPLPQGRLLLLVSAEQRLYAFSGASSLKLLGEAYQASGESLSVKLQLGIFSTSQGYGTKPSGLHKQTMYRKYAHLCYLIDKRQSIKTGVP